LVLKLYEILLLMLCKESFGMAGNAPGRNIPSRDKLCLFDRDRPDEVLYDRYALALAATERARELRDEALIHSVGRIRWMMRKWSRESQLNACDPRILASASPEWRTACARHSIVCGRIIDAVSGLSVSEFNTISRTVAGSPDLKQKVLHQAYLYRLASKIDTKRDPIIAPSQTIGGSSDSTSSSTITRSPPDDTLLKAYNKQNPRGSTALDGATADSIKLFASLAKQVQHLQQQQRAQLVSTLKIDEFPDLPICDDRVLPFMSQEVRDLCRAFPAKAEALVRSYGVDYSSFEKLLAKVDSDPIFRWRLKRQMRQLDN